MERGFRVRSFTSELNKSFHDRTSLKCIWTEIFDKNFIVLLESVLKDKINAVYRLLITFPYPQLWRSEVLKIKWNKWQEIEQRLIKIDKILWRHNVCMEIDEYSYKL